jgi:hypothetical protein
LGYEPNELPGCSIARHWLYHTIEDDSNLICSGRLGF